MWSEEMIYTYISKLISKPLEQIVFAVCFLSSRLYFFQGRRTNRIRRVGSE